MDVGNIEAEKKEAQKAAAQKAEEPKQSFFQSLFANLFKSSNPEAEKKRRLKAIAKTFSKTKYHNFYRPSTIEVLPPIAKLFYDIYKLISPAQIQFKSNQNPNLYKAQIINYTLSEKQVSLLENFDQQKIMEQARTVPLQQLSAKLEEDFMTFSSEFDNDRMNRTENLYKAFSIFQEFCCYDYYVFIKKFSSGFQEFNFNSVPNFEKINGEYITDDLKDFCSIAYAITDENILWNDLFAYFKETQATETVSLGNWKKIVAKIKNIQQSTAFDLMIRHISGNVDYVTQVPSHHASLIEPYVDKIREEMETTLSKIGSQQKENKANQICAQIFGSTDFQTLHFYIAAINDAYAKKELSTYIYPEPLNYLKAFLLEYVKKDIREYYDVVVVRGQWDASLANPMSNAYQELLKISDEITAFDNDLSEDGGSGLKIKTLLPKTAHDPGAENIINRIISDANEQARSFLITASQDLITIGKTLKSLIEDYSKQKPEIVQNWRELERFLDHPMKEFSVGIYKKIYLFVQLMQQYLA
ncbi:MAG: hypothetical protein IK102_09735 [Treponema sp.]|nr:hypothetical protein [Treponema sp.]